VIDPGKEPGETVNGTRESRLPSGQAAGRWNFPPPLCAATINRADSDPSAHTSQRTCSGSLVPGSKSRWGDRAKAAIDRSQNGSTGSAKMALPLAAADSPIAITPLQRAQIVEQACLEPVAEGLHITHWTSPYPSVIYTSAGKISQKKLENPAGFWNNVGRNTSSLFQHKGAFE
jgi:hypothetical protein